MKDTMVVELYRVRYGKQILKENVTKKEADQVIGEFLKSHAEPSLEFFIEPMNTQK